MTLVRTTKVQILPTDHDKQLLLDTIAAYRKGCNYVSHYIANTKTLVQRKVQQQCYQSLRTQFGLPSQMACNVTRSVIGAYKTIQSNKQSWTEVKFRKPKLTLSWNRDYSLKQDCFSVGTLYSRITCAYYSQGMEQYFDKQKWKFGAANLVYQHEKFFLCISVSSVQEIQEPKDSQIMNIVGIDRGINFLVATYDSQHYSGFISGRQVKQKRAHYKKLRSELQKRHTPSARRRLKAIGERENRWMQDINHCISKALVQNYPSNTMFVLEDLSLVRKATEKVHQGYRYISVSWAYYDLEQKLKYKAQNKQQLVINVNPAYTSQQCPCCGHIEKANRNKKLHLFTCKNCGYQSNDDRIAAINLYRKGIQYLVPYTVVSE